MKCSSVVLLPCMFQHMQRSSKSLNVQSRVACRENLRVTIPLSSALSLSALLLAFSAGCHLPAADAPSSVDSAAGYALQFAVPFTATNRSLLVPNSTE